MISAFGVDHGDISKSALHAAAHAAAAEKLSLGFIGRGRAGGNLAGRAVRVGNKAKQRYLGPTNGPIRRPRLP